jgi:hypothetical protein
MGGGGLGAEVVGLVVGLADGLGFPVLGLLVVLQAATDNAVAATIVPIASRIGMGPSRVADINVSPIAGFARARVHPAVRPTMNCRAGDLLTASYESAVCACARSGFAGAPSN